MQRMAGEFFITVHVEKEEDVRAYERDGKCLLYVSGAVYGEV